MNIQSRLPTTPDEFLRWNEGREGSWDFVDGRIVEMMVRVSKAHAIISGNLQFLLRSALASPPHVVSSADFGVRTSTSVRYPDVMVDGAMGNPSDLAAAMPLLIAEVLSPSTEPIDFGPKADEYRTIDSLRYYLVLSQEVRRAWLWARGTDDRWSDPMLIEADESVDLPDLGISFNIDELYSGLPS
jgi:Uma2 family endonuclease